MKLNWCALLSTVALLGTSAWAQSPQANIVALSTHTVVPSQQSVYSLIDLQGQPAVKILPNSDQPKSLRFELHGLQYKTPVAKPYTVTALFEDASGGPLGRSQPLTFKPVTGGGEVPQWFQGLEGVVGMMGVMPVEIPVPPDTHLVTLVVSDPAGGAYPHMVGVLGNIEVVSAP